VHRLFLASLVLLAGAAVAQPAPPPLRLRGTIEKVDAASAVLKERDGRVISMAFADNLDIRKHCPSRCGLRSPSVSSSSGSSLHACRPTSRAFRNSARIARHQLS